MFAKRSETVPPSSPFLTGICLFLVLVSLDICSGRTCRSTTNSSRPDNGEGEDRNRRFPYLCSIRNPEDHDHKCGGTLINGRWLLTAAHCVDPNGTDSTGMGPFIYCGIRRRNEHRKSRMYSARAIYVHGEWESNEVEKGFDIALIELDREAELPIPTLDVAESVYRPGNRFSVVGWGLTENNRPANRIQIGINLDLVPNDTCSEDSIWGGYIKNSMICAGTGLTDTRKGDPGGPLLILDRLSGNHKDGIPRHDRLVGIASFGLDEVPEGEVPKPGVYTSVGFFHEWINCVIEAIIPNDDCPVKYVPSLSAADPNLISSDPPVAFPEIEESVPAPEREAGDMVALLDDFEDEEALERMQEAIEADDSDTVDCILSEGMDPNTKYTVVVANLSDYITSLLHYAALHNAVESAEVLVDHGADVDIRDGRQRTPLHVATERGSLGVARVLVRHGANVNARAKRGDYPLYFASYYGYESVVEFLIKEEADVNSRNDYGETPLNVAAARGFVSIVELLLENKALKSETTDSGDTPFDVICQEIDRGTECNDEIRTRLEDLLSTD